MPDGVAPVQSLLWALVGDAALRLEAAGVPSPRYDSEELAASALGVRRAQLRSVDRLDEGASAASPCSTSSGPARSGMSRSP